MFRIFQMPNVQSIKIFRQAIHKLGSDPVISSHYISDQSGLCGLCHWGPLPSQPHSPSLSLEGLLAQVAGVENLLAQVDMEVQESRLFHLVEEKTSWRQGCIHLCR